MAGTIVADIIQSDQSYASSINIASPMIVSNTINMTNGAISGNVNFDSGTLFVDATNDKVGVGTTNPSQKPQEINGKTPANATNPTNPNPNAPLSKTDKIKQAQLEKEKKEKEEQEKLLKQSIKNY